MKIPQNLSAHLSYFICLSNKSNQLSIIRREFEKMLTSSVIISTNKAFKTDSSGKPLVAIINQMNHLSQLKLDID